MLKMAKIVPIKLQQKDLLDLVDMSQKAITHLKTILNIVIVSTAHLKVGYVIYDSYCLYFNL